MAKDSDDDSLSSLSSISTSSETSITHAGQARLKKNEFQHLVSSIFDQIRSLYKFSALLRRPVVRDKYIRSISKDPSVSCFTPYDLDHVKNKFPNAGEVLIHRLAMANTRRRQQLKYWDKNHQNESEDVSSAFLPRAKPLKTRVGMSNSNAAPHDNLFPVGAANTKNTSQSIGMLSKYTKESFSTVAQSALKDNETFSGRPRTIYETSMNGKVHSLRVPDLPKVPFGRKTFDCPFCHVKLEAQMMRQRNLWK